MSRLSLTLLSLLPLLAACSAGGASAPPVGAAQPQELESEAQSDAQARSSETIVASNSRSDKLYVGNTGNNSITVYPHDAQGNVAPLYLIAGSKTGIDHPGQLSEDAQGNLYVANGSSHVPSSDPAILVFAHGARGNVAPIRKLAGPETKINFVAAMTVDKSTGKLFVVNDSTVGDDGVASNLLRFGPNANGNMAPYADGTIEFWANQIASDSTGRNILDAHDPACCSASSAGVAVWAKQFANGTAPAHGPGGINAMFAQGIADDATTQTYLITNDSGIWRFAQTTTGRGPNNSGVRQMDLEPAAVSVITSDTCGGQIALPPGPTPYTYVMHSVAFGGCATDGVYVYTNDATGNATPVRILSGAATQMTKPYGLYEGI